MLRLILDENISPRISQRLWDDGLDNYPVRDRGMLRASDPIIWGRAKEEDRTVVTINESDFAKMACRDCKHPGVLTITSGENPAGQYNMIMRDVAHTLKENRILPSLRNKITCVSDAGVHVIQTLIEDEIDTAQVINLENYFKQ